MIKTIDTETITPKMIAAMCDQCEELSYLPYKNVVKALIAFLEAAPEVSEKQTKGRLIAAAPDLLEALEMLINDQRDASLPVLVKARAALAKARGQ